MDRAHAKDATTIELKNPRKYGARMAAIGLVLYGANLAFVRWADRFFPVLAVMAFPLVLLGLWSVITGHAKGSGFRSPPAWWTAGSYVCLAVGGLVGLYVWFVA
jgi:hypothetical protein